MIWCLCLRAVSGAQLTVLNYEGVAGAAKVFMPARLLLKICIKLRATGFDHRFRRQTKKCDLHSNVQWPQDRVPELASWLKQHSTILKEHNIVLVMALLEERFRSLLEAEAPSHDLDRMRSPDGGPDKKQKSEPGFWRRIGRLWWRGPKDGAMGDETSD